MSSKKKYTFVLPNIAMNEVLAKYGIATTALVSTVPKQRTVINDLIAKKQAIVSYLDEHKKIHKCTISSSGLNKNVHYRCFWCRVQLNDEWQPIGCPVKYVPSNVIKTYYSEITDDKYAISDSVTVNVAQEIQARNDKRYTIVDKNYYEIDGIFCSFNCTLAFIRDNENNPMYQYSEMLLNQIYRELFGEFPENLIPAPHWKMLLENGGTLSLKEFRESFNKVEYKSRGIVNVLNIGRLYEEILSFR